MAKEVKKLNSRKTSQCSDISTKLIKESSNMFITIIVKDPNKYPNKSDLPGISAVQHKAKKIKKLTKATID